MNHTINRYESILHNIECNEVRKLLMDALKETKDGKELSETL